MFQNPISSYKFKSLNAYYVYGIFLVTLCSGYLGAQDYWSITSPNTTDQILFSYDLNQKYYSLNQELLNSQRNESNDLETIELPNENEEFETFQIIPTQVLSSELQRKYPRIKTYVGLSTQRQDVKLRLTTTGRGVDGWIIPSDGKQYFIQQSWRDPDTHFGYIKSPQRPLVNCKVHSEVSRQNLVPRERSSSGIPPTDAKHTIRLAVTATGEYTQVFSDDDDSNGSNKEDALGAIVSTINRVNEIYERDIQVQFILVSDTDLIFEDPLTDPFEIHINPVITSQVIRDHMDSEDYDLGHGFSAGSKGGAAFVGGLCNASKDEAYSIHHFGQGGIEFMNDHFDIDYVCHEIGHQLGASHTFSLYEEYLGTHVEPASGSTIMGYAGISGLLDIQDHASPYFHFKSIQQMASLIAHSGCLQNSKTIDIQPIKSQFSGKTYDIPLGTPFNLTVDNLEIPDNYNVTYNWEQLDNGIVTRNNFLSTNLTGTIARSFPPTRFNNRKIPRLKKLQVGKLFNRRPLNRQDNDNWETLSEVERQLKWGLSIRTSQENEYTVSLDSIYINVWNDAKYFALDISRKENRFWESGQLVEITWNVGNTDKPPISTLSVDILLSTDGGKNFDVILANDLSNNGRNFVRVPGGIATKDARIKIVPNNSIYFTMTDFPIEISERPYVVEIEPIHKVSCGQDEIEFDYTINKSENFDESIELIPVDLPDGFSAEISADENGEGLEGTLKLTGISDLNQREYLISLRAISSSTEFVFQSILKIEENLLSPPELISPTIGDTNVSLRPVLEWRENESTTYSLLELSTLPDFSQLLFREKVLGSSFTPSKLESSETYYWRVKHVNSCGESDYSDVQYFTTDIVQCRTIELPDLPVLLKDKKMAELGIPFGIKAPIVDLDIFIDIDHDQFPGMALTLVSPDGIKVQLLKSSKKPRAVGKIDPIEGSLRLTFDMEATTHISQDYLEQDGVYRPLGSLKSLYNTSSKGTWILLYENDYRFDRATISAFELRFCLKGELVMDSDSDGISDDLDNCPQIKNIHQNDIDNNGIGDLCDYRSSRNITISLSEVSCRGKADGRIKINALAPLDYNLVIRGPQDYFREQSFSGEVSLSNLGIGTYEIQIRSDEVLDFSYDYTAIIKAPPNLSVQASVNEERRELELRLYGAQKYFVEVEENVFEVKNSTFKFKLKNRWSKVNVRTDNPCQGIFDQWVSVGNESQVYPNPVEDDLHILLPGGEDLRVKLFNASGKLLLNELVLLNSIDVKEFIVPMSQYPPGLYVVVIRNGVREEKIKVVKK